MERGLKLIWGDNARWMPNEPIACFQGFKIRYQDETLVRGQAAEHSFLHYALFQDHLRDAEFQAEVIPNQGSGAAAMRIEAVRRIFPRCWFNEATTEAGRDALGYYHERMDEHLCRPRGLCLRR
jgi:hypothetical protein